MTGRLMSRARPWLLLSGMFLVKHFIETMIACLLSNGLTEQGHRHGFLSGGTNRRQCGQHTTKYPKNRKTPDSDQGTPFMLESGDVPLLAFHFAPAPPRRFRRQCS